jgi:hypothetical protein
MALYPNPADDQVEVAAEEALATEAAATPNQQQTGAARAVSTPANLPKPMQVTVYNGQGYQVFASPTVTAPTVRLNTQAWPSGLYQVVIQSGKTTTRRQLSVQH